MTHIDISEILAEWPYDPARNVRRISSAEGGEKLQVRLPLGLEQYELDGRPDGLRPEGFESCLELFEHRIEHEASQAELTSDDCKRLHEEGVLYYFRYYLCFQIGDFDRVIRDAERNLRMFDFIGAHSPRKSDRVRVDQHRPYVLRMLASAKALKLSGEKKFDAAAAALEDAVEKIESMPAVPAKTFRLEKERSLSILAGMIQEMRAKMPPSEREGVRERLSRAIRNEDYERAARLRDVLDRMEETEERGD